MFQPPPPPPPGAGLMMGLPGQPQQQQQQQAQQQKHDIFVGNLAFSTTEEQLHQAFSEIGRLIKVRMVNDLETGKPRGFAFIEFEDPQAALSAIRNMNDYELNGRRIRVNFSNSSHLEALAGKLGMDLSSNNQNSNDVNKNAQDGGAIGANGANGKTGTNAISNALLGMSKGEMYDVISQLKQITEKDPDEARKILCGHPQLPEAILYLMSKLDMIRTPLESIMTAGSAFPNPMTIPPPNTPLPPTNPNKQAFNQPPPSRISDPRVSDPRAGLSDPRAAARAADPRAMSRDPRATSSTSGPPNTSAPPPSIQQPPPPGTNMSMPPPPLGILGMTGPPPKLPPQPPHPPPYNVNVPPQPPPNLPPPPSVRPPPGVPPPPPPSGILPPSSSVANAAATAGGNLDSTLVNQVMSLTDQQIAALPQDKQQSILALRQQIRGGR